MAGHHLEPAAVEVEPRERALVRSVLAEQWNQAMFVTELVACLATAGGSSGGDGGREALPVRVEAALSALEDRGEVVVSRVPAPDPCLVDDDLRVVALVGDGGTAGPEVARERIAAVAQQLAREVLATHTCA